MIEIANGKHTRAANRAQYVGQSFSFGQTDKENMAALQVGQCLALCDTKRVSVDLLVENGLPEDVIEGIVADDADDERRCGGGKCFGRPFYKFCEIKNEGGFELKFGRGGILCPGRWTMEEGRQQQQMAKVGNRRVQGKPDLESPGDLAVNSPLDLGALGGDERRIEFSMLFMQ